MCLYSAMCGYLGITQAIVSLFIHQADVTDESHASAGGHLQCCCCRVIKCAARSKNLVMALEYSTGVRILQKEIASLVNKLVISRRFIFSCTRLIARVHALALQI